MSCRQREFGAQPRRVNAGELAMNDGGRERRAKSMRRATIAEGILCAWFRREVGLGRTQGFGQDARNDRLEAGATRGLPHEPRASNSKHRSSESIGPKWFNARPHPGPLPNVGLARGEGESVSAFCQHGGARLAMVQGFNARNPVSGDSCGGPRLQRGFCADGFGGRWALGARRVSGRMPETTGWKPVPPGVRRHETSLILADGDHRSQPFALAKLHPIQGLCPDSPRGVGPANRH